MPGDWLLGIARVFFDDSILASVVQPTIADFRQEVLDAGSNAGARLLAHARGYVAFWSIVLISPFVFRNWPGRHQHGRSMATLTIVTAFLAIVIGLRTQFNDAFQWLFTNVPESAVGLLSTANGWAFLAGPIVIGLVALRRRTSPDGARLQSSEVMLLGLLPISIGAVLTTAGVWSTFAAIGVSGSAGLGSVSGGIRNAMFPTFYSAVTAIVCLAGAAVLAVREGRTRERSPQVEPMPARTAAALSVLVGITLLAVFQLVRLQHETAFWTLQLLLPSGEGSSGQVIVGASGRTFPTLLVWGTVLTLVVVMSGLAIGRTARSRAPHPIFVWSSRLGVALALAGAVWHASSANWYARTFDTMFTQAEEQARQPRARQQPR